MFTTIFAANNNYKPHSIYDLNSSHFHVISEFLRRRFPLSRRRVLVRARNRDVGRELLPTLAEMVKRTALVINCSPATRRCEQIREGLKLQRTNIFYCIFIPLKENYRFVTLGHSSNE